uniref:Tensin-1-like n=1 Tax=Dermatophagoides pteronyssinus TaxID=6956 RepID=A0A6P6XTM4_DERPT|nr:tensin-1-like [Dermatophagoides pteronyssinus]
MEPLKVDQRLIVFSLVDTFTKLSPNKILENYLKKLIAEQQHDGHHIAVFNLAEPLKFYQNINNSDKFLANVKLLEFGWPERRAPSLERLCSLCKSLDSWLTQNDQNSAIIYSKRDLSRASLAIAVFLQYIDICLGNDSNTTIFDFESMYNYFHYNLETYLQPSQKKYVNYFKSLLNGDSRINVQKLHLNQLIIHRVPNFDGCGRCRPFIKIYQGWQLRYSSPVIDIDNEFLKCWNYIVFDIQPPLKLRGEILIKCYHKSAVPSSKTEMFAFQFHTGTLTTTTVTLDKSDLDCALYDRRLPDDIQVELVFNNDRSNQILDSGQSSYQIDDDSQIIRCNSYENFFNTQTTAAMTQKSSVGTATVEDKCVPSLEYTKGPLDGSLYATVLKKPTSIEPATNQQQLLPEQPQQAKIKDEFVLDELINEIFTEIQSFPDVRTNLETKPIPLRTQSSSSKESYYDFVTKNGQEYLSEIPGGDLGKENIDPIVSEQQQNLDWLQRQQQKLLTIRRNRPKQTVEQQLIAELKTSIKQSPSSMVHRSTPPEVPTRTSSRNIFLSQIPYQDDTDNDDYGIIHKIQNGANNQSINEQTVMKIDEVERDKNVNQYIDSLAELPTSSAQFLAGLKLTDSDSQQLRSSTPAFPVRQKNRKLSSLLKQTMNDGQHNVPMFIQDTSSYWYKPTISREEAVRYLQDRPPGSFIIRDSNSFPNAFGLAVRVAREDARPDSIDPVRHFLIESTNKGVQIKGCLEEPVFSSLAALVYQHSITKISLPIRLTIPSSNDDLDMSNYGSLYSDTNLLKQFYENGAACNVLYFIKEDVESLTGNAAIKKVIDQMIMNSSDRKKIQPAIIHFKASSKGITLTDNSHRLFFRQHYPIKSISFCSIDPDNRCWPYHSDHIQLESYLFGFVTQKKNTPLENECLIFGHYEPDQPPHAIVDFVNKLKNVS